MVALPGEGSAMRFEILGRPAAWRDGRELDLGPGKQRAVLAVLLLTPNRAVSTASIVAAVWGDEPPDNGANVVQKYVAGLRRVLEPERSPRTPGRLLRLTGAGYALNVPPDGLDAEVFQDQVKEAQAARAAGDAGRAEALLHEALAMWRGPALAGLNGQFFDAARDRLEEERAAALEASAEVGLDLGRHAQLVPELIRLVAEFPLREGLRYLLMLALYRCGRQAEALAAYRDARAYFAEEFGVEPGERLQSLHLGILRSDPALASPPAREPEGAGDPPPEPPTDDLPARPGDDDVSPPAAHAVPSFAPPDSPAVPARAEGSAAPLPPPFLPASAPAHPPVYGPPPVGVIPADHGRPAHAAWAAPRRRRFPWGRIILVTVPMLSFGAATWALIGYFAGRRRSLALGLMAFAYLVMTVVFFTGVEITDPDHPGWWDLPLTLSLLGTTFGGSLQLALLTAEPASSGPHGAGPTALDVELIERRVRREQARSLAAHHPAVARMLGIGRPDLPRAFDDGGLVDVNSAPEHLLATLPGLDPYHAKLVVLARTAHGPLSTVDDLATRHILPYQAVYALRDVLVALPPAAAGEPDAPADGAAPPGPPPGTWTR
ncbi:BTAD domain-containing putative transcriptional regulator [Actinomadura sp. K4S16]|uniref:BTAD domain-containing putative transcriptional regulator n=1 Tax=Actinomadura sp. K4S16 TaxID=1316147 RepID=UPI0011EF98C8|nr:BTAD domain-containing putative transcriptional regulator [Actinomadura sp. K4S16]